MNRQVSRLIHVAPPMERPPEPPDRLLAQAKYVARRFALPPALAAVVAENAFANLRRRA